MSIRTRLALGVALVLAVTFATLGFVLVRSTRATLLDQVDDRLIEVSAYTIRTKGPSAAVGTYGETGGDGSYGDYGQNSPQTYAEVVFAPDGTPLSTTPTGFADDPDPIPRLPDFPSGEADSLIGRIVTLPAIDESFDYRVFVKRDDGGNYVVIAAPLEEVDQAVSRVVGTVTIGGAGILGAAALVSWWLIRRGLRPVDGMVDTAAAIAGGDLSRRVPASDPRTELGRLGEALNEMLGQIERGVAERAANEERLRRFVADAAHELRTPLTSVRGYAELYRQGALTDGEGLAKAMGRIEAEGSRMARLVDDLLLLARLDRQVSLDREAVDLAEVVSEAVEDFRVLEQERAVATGIAGPVIVEGDRVRLRQVIDNLLANVRVHTAATTPVLVSVGRRGMNAEVVVADEGPGIPEADRARVFERFWRGDPSRGRKTGGTGLGLAIVASLAQAHGGGVELVSEGGRGAAFTVRIPLKSDVDGRAMGVRDVLDAGSRRDVAKAGSRAERVVPA